MEDLLNEEDFLPKKAYNPWKGYGFFYVLATLNVFVAYITGIYHEEHGLPIAISAIISIFTVLFFIFSPFIMVFHKKDFLLLPPKTIILSLFLLISTYYISFLFTDLHDRGYENFIKYFISDIIIPFIVMYAYGLLCCLIIIRIVLKKQKRINVKKL